jgi:hypothetical protein
MRFFDVRVFEAEQLPHNKPTRFDRKPVTKGIQEAFQRLKARRAHYDWTTKAQAQRAIRDEYDGQGADQNARRMVDAVLKKEIDQVLAENRTRAAEGNGPSERPENKQ